MFDRSAIRASLSCSISFSAFQALKLLSAVTGVSRLIPIDVLRVRVVQVVYEVNVKGVDERRLVGVQLQKLAEGEAGAAFYFMLSGMQSFRSLYFLRTLSINCGKFGTMSSGSGRITFTFSSMFDADYVGLLQKLNRKQVLRQFGVEG